MQCAILQRPSVKRFEKIIRKRKSELLCGKDHPDANPLSAVIRSQLKVNHGLFPFGEAQLAELYQLYIYK